jgi:hypothetical protein
MHGHRYFQLQLHIYLEIPKLVLTKRQAWSQHKWFQQEIFKGTDDHDQWPSASSILWSTGHFAKKAVTT